LDDREAADTLLHCCSPWTVSFGKDLLLPILTAEVILLRRFERDALDDLKAKAMQRLDVLTLESMAKS
jgi:hypothetical protein